MLSKASGTSLAKIAAKVMAGRTLAGWVSRAIWKSPACS
jgi:hypothetical protein